MTSSKAKMYVVAALILGAFAVTACQKKDEGGGAGGGGTVAATPCTATCDNQHYGQYPQGFIPPTAYTYGPNNGFCGCAPGQRPIYNMSWGYSCVPANYLTYNNYLGYNTSSIYQAQNLSPSNMTQITYSPLPYGGTNDCYGGAAAACLVADTASCGANGFCRPVGGGSRVGVCVNTNTAGVDNYYPGGNTAYPPYNNNPYSYGSNCRITNKWGFSFYVCGGYGY